jgi:hypothetical protein
MSEPTYRIEVERRPEGLEANRYSANVYLLTDGSFVFAGYGKDTEAAIQSAQRLIANHREEPPMTLFASEAGEIVSAPEQVSA